MPGSHGSTTRGRGGLGLEPSQHRLADQLLAAAGAPSNFAINPIGLGMTGPTVAHHGTDEQCDRLLRPLSPREEIWCQLFSEPGAGSDLAGLATSAVRDGDEWIVNGQKVWTSLGHRAPHGLLLARTDPTRRRTAASRRSSSTCAPPVSRSVRCDR